MAPIYICHLCSLYAVVLCFKLTTGVVLVKNVSLCIYCSVLQLCWGSIDVPLQCGTIMLYLCGDDCTAIYCGQNPRSQSLIKNGQASLQTSRTWWIRMCLRSVLGADPDPYGFLWDLRIEIWLTCIVGYTAFNCQMLSAIIIFLPLLMFLLLYF